MAAQLPRVGSGEERRERIWIKHGPPGLDESRIRLPQEPSDRFAGWLASRGIRPGDRVAIFLENCPQFAIAYYGAMKAGAIPVCLNPMHKAVEL